MSGRHVKTSAVARWTCLSSLLADCERLLEANCRLDFYEPADRLSRIRARDSVCTDLDDLVARVDTELSRITVERLTLDLDRKRRERAA